jgi:hypothetical protein
MIRNSRRELILKMGAWPLLWPLLRSNMSNAAPTTQPKRILVFCSTNGPIGAVGPTVGTETNFNFHDWWSPLERHKADGVYFVGCDQAGVPFGESNWDCGHNPGSMGALTATASEKSGFATGPSIDSFVGQELQKLGVVTPKRSLLWGVGGGIGNKGPWFEAAKKPATVELNPYNALASIAPGLGTSIGGVPSVDPKLLRRRLALSTAYKDCKELTGALGPEGRRLLDFHCTNVESLEKNVAQSITNAMSMPSSVDCTAPSKPNTSLPQTANFGSPDNYDEALKAYADMAALAFACDVTRAIGISFGGGAARFAVPSKYGIASAARVDSGDSGPQHHAWTHTYNDGPEKRGALKGFYHWYSNQVALFIDKLKATKDASGKPLMDSTLVLWTSELGSQGDGKLEPHPNSNIPVLLFGNSGGAFKTNRMYKGSGGPNSALVLHKMFVSIAQHAGLSVNAFGNQGQGALDWLKG